MKNISQETNNLLETIRQYGPLRSSELAKKLGISAKTVYKHLGILLDEQLITKTGETPRVYYAIKSSHMDELVGMGLEDQLIEQNYIYVAPSGEMMRGINGFWEWCRKNKFDFEKEKTVLAQKIKAAQKLKKNGVISAKKTILSGKKELHVFFMKIKI